MKLKKIFQRPVRPTLTPCREQDLGRKWNFPSTRPNYKKRKYVLILLRKLVPEVVQYCKKIRILYRVYQVLVGKIHLIIEHKETYRSEWLKEEKLVTMIIHCWNEPLRRRWSLTIMTIFWIDIDCFLCSTWGFSSILPC